MLSRRSTAVGLLVALLAAGCDDDPCTTCVDDAIHGFAREFDGAPMAGVHVVVTGKPAVVTGTDGSFTVSGVTPPYDIALEASVRQVWRGLTRRDPILYSILGGTPRAFAGTQVSGQLPMTSDQFAHVFFVSAEFVRHSTRADPFTGRYSFYPEWLEGSNPVGKLYVMRGTTGMNGLPIQFDGWGSKDLALTPNTPVAVNFAPNELVDVPEGTISGHVNLPAGFTLVDFLIDLQFDTQESLDLLSAGQAVDPSGDFTLQVPEIASTSLEIYAKAYASGNAREGFSHCFVRGLHAGSQGVAVTMQSPPALLSPAAAATGVDTTTTFSWNPGSGQGLYLYILRSNDFRTTLYLLQEGTSLRWADLPMTTFRPEPDADYNWYVRQLQSIQDIDAAAAPGIVPILFAAEDDAGSEVRDLRTSP